MPIEVEHYANLDDVAVAAGDRLGRAAQASPYDRLTWWGLIAQHCPPAGKPLVIRARDGEAEAWLPLMRDGNEASALSRWYSLRVGPAFYAADDPAVRTRLLTAIGGYARKLRLAAITLAPMEPLLAEAIATGFRAVGWKSATADASANWQVTTANEDFDAYWAKRPGRLRSTAKRKTKLAALDIAIHRQFDAAAWDAYEEIYAQSWKPEEGSPSFVRALAEQEGAAGTLRLGVAWKDGRPLAAQFWVVENGVATIHKLSHVKDADAASPGTVLSTAMFRHVIEEDYPDCIDFGTGDDKYKAEWTDRRRMLARIELLNPRTVKGLYRIARLRLATLVRKRSAD